VAVGHALEHALQVGVALGIVELGGGNEGADGRPTVGAAVRSGKQMVLTAEGDRPDRAFNSVGVEFNAAITEETAENLPAA
jgi:hypothetical protein